ncbi:MAG: chemotaxis protein CheD [Verrucomicrobiae bacterium]|nr:chemotaxis protein CheD [Verrucomicrobiae bacterium]
MPPPVFRKTIVVGVADMAVTNDTTADLVTYSLGSCLGITVYDPTVHVGGLLHLMLPDSSIDKVKAEEAPYMFVDTGVPLLFRTAYQLGADKSRIILKVAGGAEVISGHDLFNIGKRNIESLYQILTRNNVQITSQRVGGQVSRTVRLDVGTGKVLVKTPGEEDINL